MAFRLVMVAKLQTNAFISTHSSVRIGEHTDNQFQQHKCKGGELNVIVWSHHHPRSSIAQWFVPKGILTWYRQRSDFVLKPRQVQWSGDCQGQEAVLRICLLGAAWEHRKLNPSRLNPQGGKAMAITALLSKSMCCNMEAGEVAFVVMGSMQMTAGNIPRSMGFSGHVRSMSAKHLL